MIKSCIVTQVTKDGNGGFVSIRHGLRNLLLHYEKLFADKEARDELVT